MTFAKFAVCEAANRWTVALRWGLTEGQPRLVVTRNLEDCWRLLVSSPASFITLELNESNLESIVQRLQDLGGAFPLARAAVVCDPALASCEWLVREAGAIHVSVSNRDMSTIIRLAERHIAQARRPEVGVRQAVWDRLAWQDI